MSAITTGGRPRDGEVLVPRGDADRCVAARTDGRALLFIRVAAWRWDAPVKAGAASQVAASVPRRARSAGRTRSRVASFC